MSINEQNRNSKYTPDRYQSEKSYNGVKPTDSQVLAPFVIRDRAMLVNKDVNRDNLKTFNIYYFVMFVKYRYILYLIISLCLQNIWIYCILQYNICSDYYFLPK